MMHVLQRSGEMIRCDESTSHARASSDSALCSRRAMAGGATALLASALVGLAAKPVRVRAVSMVAGSTELTQLANNISLIQQNIQLIKQAVTLAKQLANSAQNLKKLVNGGEIFQILNGFRGVLAGASNILFTGESLAKRWAQTHPGRKDPASTYLVNGKYPTDIKHADAAAYRQIDDSIRTAVEKELQVLDVQGPGDNGYRQDEAIFEALQQKIGTEEGVLQAQQLGNQLLLEIVRQLGMLRYVQHAHANLMGEYVSADLQRRMYDDALEGRDRGYTGRYRSNRYIDWSKR